MRIIKLDHTTRDNILSDLLKRDPNNYDSYGAAVQEIVEAVKMRQFLPTPKNSTKSG